MQMKCSVKTLTISEKSQTNKINHDILLFFVRRFDFNNLEMFCSEEAKPFHLDFIICFPSFSKLLCHVVSSYNISSYIIHKTLSTAALHQADVHPASTLSPAVINCHHDFTPVQDLEAAIHPHSQRGEIWIKKEGWYFSCQVT